MPVLPPIEDPIMSTATVTKTVYTPEDLLAMPDDKGYELVDGQLVERKMGIKSTRVGTRLIYLLERFCEDHPVGWTLQAEGGYQCFPHEPGLVRRPDLSFIRYGRFPGGALPEGWSKIRPDLVVEVVSPNETVYELDDKLDDYEKVAVPLIWVINPRARTAMVYRADGTVSRLREDDELSGEDVIPGFRCRVSDILPTREPNAEASPDAHGATTDA
jgi:Uma2 family endonuclease